MLKKLASWLLYKQLKWKKKVTIAFPDKFIICLVGSEMCIRDS